MAITNAQIIFMESLRLMDEGVLKGSGRVATMIINDEERTIEMPEPIHTFASWKSLGYVVRKGEKARAAFSIWKYVKKGKNVENEESLIDNGYCIMKLAHFFTAEQVEPLAAKA